MNRIHSRCAAAAGFMVVAGFLAWSPPVLAQGSLLPPGPPAPSMKTLDQLEPRTLISELPFTIASSGSYFLTTNLAGAPARDGIVIQADDVSIDLNGYSLLGGAGSSNGIACPLPRQNLRVFNGTIRNWGAHGIDGVAGGGGRFERLNVTANGGRGMRTGDQTVIEGCIAFDNAEDGIHTGSSSIVRNSITSRNRGNGIVVGAGGSVIECTAVGNLFDGFIVEGGSRVQNSVSRQNLRHGLSGTTNVMIADFSAEENESRGISLGDGARITSTSAAANGENGIQVESAARISDCTARSNVGSGIRTGPNSEVSESVVQGNEGRGIMAGAGSGITACLSAGNGGVGVEVEHTARVRDCTVQANFQGGIVAGKGSTVRECSVLNNGGDGIRVSTECLVVGNNCHGNDNVIDAAGIHATGTKNQIRDNSVTSNVRGVSLDVDGNFVARNLASNNTLNYRRTPNQTMGSVLTTLDDASSAQAWANFAF